MPHPDADALRGRLAAVLAGRFVLGDVLGVGGFAVVFRARDLALERDVAIKVLEVPGDAAREAELDRSLDEARLVATIEHPHIVPLYEVGREQGLVFLVMRFYPHGSLARRLEGGRPMAPDAIVGLGATVADALATAHDRGVIHLDIKPGNILLDAGGNAAVTDFGIAQVMGSASGSDGMVSSGTPHYMSPEHVSGDTLDARSDVYALGVVLYEAATGRPPISGSSAAQVMANQVRQSAPPIASLVPEFPVALAGVIMKALAKDPAERWPSTREMAAALRALIGSDRMLSPAAIARKARRRWMRRGAIGCALVIVGLGVAAYLGVQFFRAINSGPRPAVDALAPNIPESLIDSAAALGLLRPGDTARYIFVPAGRGMADATVITQAEIVRLLFGMPRRWRVADDPHVNLALNPDGGFLIIRGGSAMRADTLYTTLTGRELNTLRDAMSRVFREVAE